ncbi:hypothetical protein INR49_013805 [Caranx melampygus]|nr:hypothetical protein INR49_013805 [Caranx melampygus]
MRVSGRGIVYESGLVSGRHRSLRRERLRVSVFSNSGRVYMGMALCGAKCLRFLGPNVYPEAPDGGWGWVVAVAFFLVEAFTYGTIKSFGIFLQDLMEEFGETNSRVSWIVSICVFVMTFTGPLSSVMTNRFGFQLVVMIGGLLISTGTITTSFTSSINQMYITYGLVAGLGYCLTFLPTVTILSKYFTRRRSLVTAVASMGESLSMFALAPGESKHFFLSTITKKR